MNEKPFFVNGKEFNVELVQSRGHRAVAEIHGYTIKVRMPTFLSKHDAEEAFADLRERVIKRLEKTGVENLEKPKHLKFYNNQEVSVIGNTFRIEIREGTNKSRSTANIAGNILSIVLASNLSEEERKRHASNLTRRCIARASLKAVSAKVNDLNERHFGFGFNKVRIRDQSTRWGSCSKVSGNINLNFRLLFAPQGVFDYVVIHELAHLKESNHSYKFWNIVEGAMPNYKESRTWLRKNGNTLGVQSVASPQSPR